VSNYTDAPALEQFSIYRERPFIVIIAMGRSGSTLLQGILNSFPDYLIRGENFGFLQGLYRSNHSIRRTKVYHESDSVRMPWYGSRDLDDDLFRFDIAPLIARQLVGRNCAKNFRAIGFKEIRWTQIDLGETNLMDFLEFIENIFPLSKFILLTRNIDEIIVSGWWPTTEVVSMRSHITLLYMAARATRLKSFFEIDYSELVEDGARLRAMCEFLDERYTPKIAEVLKIRHGS
jgi:Sulfotransferase family